MGIFSIFQSKRKTAPLPDEHAVILTIDLSHFDFGVEEEQEQIRELADELDELLQTAGAGDCDGEELGDGEATIYLYGADADIILKTVKATLEAQGLKPIRIKQRYGPADDPAAKEVDSRIV